MKNKLFDSIECLAKKSGVMKYYFDDLLYDKKILDKYGDCDYVFLLRECGSQLIPLKKGISPLYISYYIENDNTSVLYHISVKKDFEKYEIKEITKQKALYLINQLPVDFGLVSSFDDLERKITLLLEDLNVTSKLFHECKIDNNHCNWPKFEKWFSDHPVMKVTLSKAINLKNKLL